MERLASERTVHEDRPSLDAMVTRLTGEIERAHDYLRAVPPEALLEHRDVGRKKLPSTTMGLNSPGGTLVAPRGPDRHPRRGRSRLMSTLISPEPRKARSRLMRPCHPELAGVVWGS